MHKCTNVVKNKSTNSYYKKNNLKFKLNITYEDTVYSDTVHRE